MQDPLKEFIRAEITKQLKQLKQTLDEEIKQDIATLRKELTAVIDQKYTAMNGRVDAVNKKVTAQADTRTTQNTQSAPPNSLALVTKEETRQLVKIAVQEATNVVYNEVMGEINKKIVPKVDSMVRYVNYQMQDGQSIVTDYRKAVHRQEKSDNAGLLTNGGDTSHILSENVELFFHTGD